MIFLFGNKIVVLEIEKCWLENKYRISG